MNIGDRFSLRAMHDVVYKVDRVDRDAGKVYLVNVKHNTEGFWVTAIQLARHYRKAV